MINSATYSLFLVNANLLKYVVSFEGSFPTQIPHYICGLIDTLKYWR